MAIDSQATLITNTQNLMGGSFDKVSDAGFLQAAAQAEIELSISTYPVTNSVICYWAVERMRRHVIYILLVESAHKFQYKQIHIEHRFKHYIQLIEKMDQEWLDAMEDNPDLFGGVYDNFAYYLETGFVYDALGRDITYDNE